MKAPESLVRRTLVSMAAGQAAAGMSGSLREVRKA